MNAHFFELNLCELHTLVVQPVLPDLTMVSIFFLLRNISRIVVLCYLKLFFLIFNFTLTFYLTLIDIYLTVQVTVLFLYALIFSSINIHLIGLEEET